MCSIPHRTPRRLRRVKSTTPLHQSSSAGSPKWVWAHGLLCQMQSVFPPFPFSPSLLPHPTVYLPHPFYLPLPPSLPFSPLRRSISVTGVHQSPALSAMDISLLLCNEQEDLSLESGPPRQRLKVPGSGQSSTASSLASSRRGMCVRRREGRRRGG